MTLISFYIFEKLLSLFAKKIFFLNHENKVSWECICLVYVLALALIGLNFERVDKGIYSSKICL